MGELSIAIAFGSFFVTIVSFVATQIAQKKFAEKAYVEQLMDRLEVAEESLRECRSESKILLSETERLREHNYRLMLRVTELERKSDAH